MVALPGVQRFIAESRTTSDLASASQIIASLSRPGAGRCAELGARLVFPAWSKRAEKAVGEEATGVPNRIVAIVAAGTGPEVAAEAAKAVHAEWQSLLGRIYKDPLPETPGMPDVIWVSVPASAGTYQTQWDLARRTLEARRRVRDFRPVDVPEVSPCSLSPRWPTAPTPANARPHHRDEQLSAANWLKRQWRSTDKTQGVRDSTPSTYSIASAPFRKTVLSRLHETCVDHAVRALHAAATSVSRDQETPIPGLSVDDPPHARWLARSGGPWVYPETWSVERLRQEEAEHPERALDLEKISAAGRKAAKDLAKAMDAEPATYLAILAQDLDSMGRFLGGESQGRSFTVDPGSHRDVSQRLRRLAGEQVADLRSPSVTGVPIYAGGDDLLTFTPAVTALDAARAVHDRVPTDELPTASTAVVFFHQRSSLRRAVEAVQELLEQAKSEIPGKNGLAVGYLRRSGVRAVSVQPWRPADGTTPAIDLWAEFGGGHEYPISPRLVADLERDEAELTDLMRLPDYYRAEIHRLIGRHLGGPAGEGWKSQHEAITSALLGLGQHEQSGTSSSLAVAKIGVFLRKEAR